MQGPEYRLPVSSLAKYIDFTSWEPGSDASYYADGTILVKGPGHKAWEVLLDVPDTGNAKLPLKAEQSFLLKSTGLFSGSKVVRAPVSASSVR